ncbi:hypothetical protein FN846DRAFT_780900 [Sphaerosporella brunnea]|uniref:Large ribosomal subunit protein mL59 domain-containing protein n=1 Tax=Sphaerosporella brunnea TaxID=1250544 RepID=A0A5J5ESP4_9PEZI|nr:hypothetical protein FN846DRAFT_780913 [Sphaerosporella brunnea]KAA8901856.1 hypothetical protein FN846DRAFT_780900 [Sphaerosporella brunnea]
MSAAAAAAAASSSSSFVSVCKLLPARLTRFFARYPPGSSNDVRRNPFKPTVHPATGKWHNPVYSLRRQAELFKLARKYGVEELLPPSKKSSAEREAARARREARGLRVRGHKEERTLKARIEVRRAAMERMPKLIEEWKRRGHGRGWKEWPSGKAQF